MSQKYQQTLLAEEFPSGSFCRIVTNGIIGLEEIKMLIRKLKISQEFFEEDEKSIKNNFPIVKWKTSDKLIAKGRLIL